MIHWLSHNYFQMIHLLSRVIFFLHIIRLNSYDFSHDSFIFTCDFFQVIHFFSCDFLPNESDFWDLSFPPQLIYIHMTFPTVTHLIIHDCFTQFIHTFICNSFNSFMNPHDSFAFRLAFHMQTIWVNFSETFLVHIQSHHSYNVTCLLKSTLAL